MKKSLLLTISIIALFALLLAACSQPTEEASEPEATEVSGLVEETTEPVGEEAAETTEEESVEPLDEVTLIIESWRQDDLVIWEDQIIPAFEETHPGIKVEFRPTINTEYSTALATKLEGGTAGDLIMIEPFDFRLDMYLDGDLANLNDLEGLDNFSDLALSAWSTDDGSEVFGLPLAAVLHGFIYNKEIFDELGLEEPATEQEFLDLLAQVQEDGQYVPLAMGTADSFVPGLLGFQLIGPAYWHGEEGRLALIDGSGSFTDQSYIDTWSALQAWTEYMPEGFEGIGYSDMQNQFILGQAAVYPAGSWEIPIFNDQIGDEFERGAFPPPVPSEGDQCYINDHMDMGMGINANAEHPEEARVFAEWMTTAEFAELWNNALPGFFSLSNHAVAVNDPMAQTFLSWREDCLSSPRNSYQIISRGEPNTDAEISRVTTLVMNGEMTPEEAAQTVQDGLASWYEPQQ